MTRKQNKRLENILFIIAMTVFFVTTVSFIGKVNCQQRYQSMLVRFDMISGCEVFTTNNQWVKGN